MLTSWLLKSKDKQSSKDKQPLGKSFAIGCCNIGESILTNSATLLHKSQEKSRASFEPKNKSRVCNVLTSYGVHIKQVYLGSKEVSLRNPFFEFDVLLNRAKLRESKSETVKKSEADTLQKTAPSLHVETHKSATAKDVVAENYAASKEDGWFPIQSRNVSGSTLVASPQAKSKTKVTNLSGLANILGKIVREETTVPALPHGKILSEDSTRKVKDERETTNNLRDTKPSMNSLQDEVRILNIKLEEKENVIRHLTTLREDTASLLDQQKLRNQTADSWIKVYMLLSIIAFNRMDIFERFQFFDTQVSRWLIAGAMQYISVGVFKPDCLAIENAAGDNGQIMDYHGLDSGEGDASSIDGQAGDAAHSEEEDTLSTEGQADDAAKNEREDASSTEGQVGDATAGQGEEQAGIEFSRALNFSDSMGNDLLQDISQVVADVKARQEEDEANAIAQREADEVHLRAQQQAGGFDGSLFDFANEAYVRMVYALRKLKDVGWICSPEEYETLALLAMEHLGIRERDVVSDFEAYEDKINACNEEEEEEDDSEGQDEGQDEDEDEEGGESNNKDTDNDDDDDSDEDANHKVGEENELSDEDTNVDDFSEHINDEAAMGLGHYHQDAEEDAIEESSAIIESLLDGKFAVDRLPAGVGEAIRTTPNAPGKLVMNTLVGVKGVEGAADGAGSPHDKFEEGTMKLPPPPQTLKGRATSMVSQLFQRIVSKDLASEHFIDRQGLGDKSNEYRVRPELKSQDLAIIDGGRIKTEPVTQGPAPLDGDAGPTDYCYPQGVDELDEAKEDQYAAHNENAADEYIDDDENPDQEFPDDEFRKRPNYKHHTYSRFVPGVRSDTEDLYGCHEDRKYSLMIGGFPVPNHATMENFTQKPPQYAYCIGEDYAMMSGALPEGPDGKPDPGFEDHEHHAAGDKDAERIEGGEEEVQLRSFAAALDPFKVQPITGFSTPQTSFTGALIDESSSSESEDILPAYVDDNSELQHQESLNDGLPAYEAEEIRESKTPEEVESEESPHGHNALTTEDSIEDISTPQLETSNMEAAIAQHGLADTKFPSLSVVPSTPPMKPTTDLGISSPFSTGMEVDDDDWSSKRLPTPLSRSSNKD